MKDSRAPIQVPFAVCHGGRVAGIARVGLSMPHPLAATFRLAEG